jgi:hypothetical protein
MRRYFIISMVMVLSFFTSFVTADEPSSALPAAGKKCDINDGYYFIYRFDKRPQLGTIIIKIELYNKEGKRDSSLKITGQSGMPSMGSAHNSGTVSFQLNKKGDYLLPVNVVMPGEWEVKLDFIKEDKTIFSGKILFKV